MVADEQLFELLAIGDMGKASIGDLEGIFRGSGPSQGAAAADHNHFQCRVSGKHDHIIVGRPESKSDFVAIQVEIL